MNSTAALDIVYVLDPGCDNEARITWVRCEISAAIGSGVRCGVLALQNLANCSLRPWDSWIRGQLESGSLVSVRASDRVSCRVAIVLDGIPFTYIPALPCPVLADAVWIHPHALFDLEPAERQKIVSNLEIYARAPTIQLSWFGDLDRPAWQPLVPEDLIVADPRSVAPEAPVISVLGAADIATGDEICSSIERIVSKLPCSVIMHWPDRPDRRAWDRTLQSDSDACPDLKCLSGFPADLDFFVLGPLPGNETLLLAILAMSQGALVLADLAFEPLLAEGAVYCSATEIDVVIARFTNDADAFRHQSRAALRTARQQFASGKWLMRYQELLSSRGDIPNRSRQHATISSGPEVVMMISSNGVGLGHLTRLLAVAQRLDHRLEPRFLTFSEAVGIIGEFGYGADYIPSFSRLALDKATWNAFLARRIARFIQIYRPRVAIFDGNHPYAGLIDVITTTPEITWLWIRRPLWKRGHSAEPLTLDVHFSAVIEPSELCASEDVGPTTEAADGVIQVPPTLLVDRSQILSSDEARREIGVRDDEVCVLVQLGAGSNFDFAGIRTAIISDLARRVGVRVYELHSPITADALKNPEAGVDPLVAYPSARLAAGVDLMITGAGYNTFHECMIYGVPTVYVPNEASEMDDQLLRARYAQSVGQAYTLRTHETWRVATVLDAALDPRFRANARRRAAMIGNGAADIARLIEESVDSLRVGAPLGDVIDRI